MRKRYMCIGQGDIMNQSGEPTVPPGRPLSREAYVSPTTPSSVGKPRFPLRPLPLRIDITHIIYYRYNKLFTPFTTITRFTTITLKGRGRPGEP